MPANSPDSQSLGLIGIGLLGSVLAERLVAGGFAVRGFDLDPTRLDAFRRIGGHAVAGSQAVLTQSDRIVLSLPSHREVAALVHEHSALRPGVTLIDTTTGDPATAEVLAQELASRGVNYVDATISGSSTQVREGTAVMMVGGDEAVYLRESTSSLGSQPQLADQRFVDLGLTCAYPFHSGRPTGSYRDS